MVTDPPPIEDYPTILLLEDDQDQGELFCEIALHNGYVVFVATTLEQALSILEMHHTVIDYVLSDNRVGFIEAGKKIKEACTLKNKPCLIYSGLKTPDVDLEKPLDWTLLWNQLKTGLVHGT